MALAASASQPRTNGSSHATTSDEKTLAAFYEQLLQLRDAVLADRHPRFKLSAPVKAQLQAAAAHYASPTVEHAFVPGPQIGLSGNPARNDAAFPLNGEEHARAALDQKPTHHAAHPGQKPFSTIIDPILLTKSDDLVRAEIQLKRQRIERELRDAWEQRKHLSRDKDVGGEPASLTMLSETLLKALELVKPISGLKPAPKSNNDSSDEISYYSSQVDDTFSENSTAADRDSRDDTNTAGVTAKEALSTSLHSLPGLASSISLSRPDAVQEVKRIDRQPHPVLPSGRPLVEEAGPHLSTRTDEEVDDASGEDSDYTPPEADAFTDMDADGDAMDLDDDDDSSEYTPQTGVSAAHNMALPKVPVITNHLTHIAAPQPARVSPLAVAKIPSLPLARPIVHPASQDPRPASPRVQDPPTSVVRHVIGSQSGDSTTSPRNSGVQTPSGPMTRSQKKNRAAVRREQKKKMRELEGSSKTRKHQQKRLPASPEAEPYIKPEPMSPPTFVGVPISRTRGGAYPIPSDVEIVSPREFRPRDAYYPQQQQPRQSHPQPYPYVHPSSPAASQMAPPSVPYQRPRRDDQDLRRVASLHAAQRPYSPPEPRVYSPVGPYRAVSMQHPDTRVAQLPRYHDETDRQLHYGRSQRSLSPPQLRQYRDAHMDRLASPAMMAPPPPPTARRIVVDQYGNRYYAAEPEPVLSRASVAPSMRGEPETMYERAPSRASVAYAPMPARSVYRDAELGSMPPPPSRRVVTQPELSGISYENYRQREYSVRPAEPRYYRDEPAQVYMQDGPAPPPPQRPSTAYGPEYIGGAPHFVREYSTRPEHEPAPAPRYFSRQPSVAPRTEYLRQLEPVPRPSRAVSLMPRAHEYPGMPMDSRYDYAPAPPTYMDHGGMRGTAEPQREQTAVDQYGGVVRRMGEYA